MHTNRRLAGIALGIVLAACVLVSGRAHAYFTGPPDGRCGDPPANATCKSSLCHNSYPLNSGDGSVTIQGLPARYAPGVAYAIRVVLTDPGQTRWGFQSTVIKTSDNLQGGTWAIPDTHLVQVSEGPGTARDYIMHKEAGTFPGQPNSARWNITWTAPAAGSGTVQFYLAGNAANNDDTPNFDYIYTYTTQVTELPTADVANAMPGDGLRLDICPNPASANAVLRLSVPAATSASLMMVDPSGRHVRTFPFDHLDAGVTSVPWNGLDDSGRRVAPGAYYYVLVAGGDRRTGRFIVTR